MYVMIPCFRKLPTVWFLSCAGDFESVVWDISPHAQKVKAEKRIVPFMIGVRFTVLVSRSFGSLLCAFVFKNKSCF